MNLAIEYLLRRDELKRIIKFPYSIFVSKLTNGDKIVVTIHQKPKESNLLLVKHWYVLRCRSEQRIPPFQEFEIRAEDMFASQQVVIPKCELMWYQEEPYPQCNRQYADYPHSERQELEYRETLSNFLNSNKHKVSRNEWLWQAFIKVYLSNVTTYSLLFGGDDRIRILKSFAPELTNTWLLWKKYLLDYSMEVGDVAGELLFQKEYARQVQQTKDIVLLNTPHLL